MKNEMIKNKIIDMNPYFQPYLDQKYGEFSSKLIPGDYKILGVRLPILRKLSKDLSKENWKEIFCFGKEDSQEAVLLKGMILGHVKVPLEELLVSIRFYLPKINNWSVCDCFVVSLKFTKKYKEEMFFLVEECLKDKRTYVVRFAFVMLLTYYIEENKLSFIFQAVESVEREEYYIQMAIAWLIASCYTKYPEETFLYLQECNLDKSTYKKTLQKIRDSLKVSKENKLRLLELNNS